MANPAEAIVRGPLHELDEAPVGSAPEDTHAQEQAESCAPKQRHARYDLLPWRRLGAAALKVQVDLLQWRRLDTAALKMRVDDQQKQEDMSLKLKKNRPSNPYKD